MCQENFLSTDKSKIQTTLLVGIHFLSTTSSVYYEMNLFSQPHIESRFKVSLLITYALHSMLSNLSLVIALLLAFCEGEAFGIAYTETSASLK